MALLVPGSGVGPNSTRAIKSLDSLLEPPGQAIVLVLAGLRSASANVDRACDPISCRNGSHRLYGTGSPSDLS